MTTLATVLGDKLYKFLDLSHKNTNAIEKFSQEKIEKINRIIPINQSNCINRIAIVPKEYIERAWQFVKPCLDYANDLAEFLRYHKPVAILARYLKKHKKALHSKCMQYTHLSADEMKSAVKSLVQMGCIEIEQVDVERRGSGTTVRSIYTWIGEKEFIIKGKVGMRRAMEESEDTSPAISLEEIGIG